MKLNSPLIRLCALCVTLALPSLACAEPFADQALPFFKTFCSQCHNTKKSEGQLDLSRFTSAASVGADFRQWETIITFVKKGEMPPADAKQPTAEQRASALAAMEAVLAAEAKRAAGDPGVVLPRRLSNAEYDYSIRDLIGFDIRPTESFPVDPASGEGFNNTGEALTMSPSLFKKYYAAAQHVADHALVTPSGLRFAPHPVVTFADQKQYGEQAILKFYERHKVNYETYLTAAWRLKHRPVPAQKTWLEEFAIEQRLSPKYLRTLWELLNGDPTEKFFLGELRRRWRAIPAREAEALPLIRNLAADIQKLAVALCVPETQAIVSNAGNGPVQHIDRRTRTAASRDVFSTDVLRDNARLNVELKRSAENPTKIVFRVSPFGDNSGASFVTFRQLFLSTQGTNNYNPKNAEKEPEKYLSLRKTLQTHAPDQAAKLKWGVDSRGEKAEGDHFTLRVPTTVEIELPAAAFGDAKSWRLFADVSLDRANSPSGAARAALLDPSPKSGKNGTNGGEDFDSLARLANLLIDPSHPLAAQVKSSGEAFCRVFPNRFFYVDDTRGLSAGFHLIEGFFRDDQPLAKLVLENAQRRELDTLWDELNFISNIAERELRGFVFFERSERNFMKHPDFDSIKEEDPDLVKPENLNRFEQIYLERSNVRGTPDEIARSPVHLFFEELRQGLKRRTDGLKQAESIYVKDLEALARRAYRRPLTAKESEQLRAFFRQVADQPEHGVEGAVRASIVRLLVSPHFCYRADPAPPSKSIEPLSDLALASRLSYFLWGSLPDDELLSLAAAGKLRDEATLRQQTRRMLRDPKVAGFARELFGQWLGYRDFLKQEAVSREAFPTFDDSLKQAMFDEPTRLITHLIQNNSPVTDLLSSDATFVNKRLAAHYGVPFAGTAADEWELVTGLRQQGRGGLLGMAVFLTKNSQPMRTSPVKRGFWVVHKLLGEHIPPPPPDVAVLPAKETDTQGKTIRDLLKLHTEDVKCARCHVRFDPVGLAMEGFDAIGRTRTKDLAGRPIDNAVELPSGEQARGVPEFARYLAAQRAADFQRTLCTKLLGYALGRSLQLSDQELLLKLESELKTNENRFIPLLEAVVTSPQFRNQRGRDYTAGR